jgi:hypothetical protein
LYSLFTATAVLGIACFSNLSRPMRKYVFLFAFLVPFTWFNGGLYKDILLQAVLCTFVLAVVSLRRRPAINAAVIVAGSALLYEFRTPYFLTGLCFGAYAMFGIENPRRSAIGVVAFLALVVVAAQTPLKEKYLVDVREQYADKTPETQPLNFAAGGPAQLIKRSAVGLLTPFPWDQTFLDPKLYLSHIADHAQSVLTLALLTLLFPLIVHQLKANRAPPPATVMAILLMIIGMSGPFIHPTYVQFGSVLLLPQGLSLGYHRLLRRCWYCLIVLLWLNGLWLGGARLIWGAGSTAA